MIHYAYLFCKDPNQYNFRPDRDYSVWFHSIDNARDRLRAICILLWNESKGIQDQDQINFLNQIIDRKDSNLIN